MTTVTIKVILQVDGEQRITKLTRELATPLASILLEVLTQYGLTGTVQDWVVRFGGVWIEWEQSLGNLVKSAGSLKGLALVPLEILPRTAISEDARTVIEEGGGEAEGEALAPTVSSPPRPSAPTVPGASAPTVQRSPPAAPPPPVPPPAPAQALPGGTTFPTPSPPLPSMPTEEPTWTAGRMAPAPAGRARQDRTLAAKVERRATVRYYSRMNPERMYPLLVVLSRQAIQEVVKQHVDQKESVGFKVALESVVEVEPILPGCNSYPPKEYVTVKESRVQAEFWVVPHVIGKLIKPRIVLRQEGKLLAEVPLEMKVVKQTLTVCMGLLSLIMPYVSMLLKKLQLDWESQQGRGFPVYAWVASEVLARLTPEAIGGTLLALTLLLYVWFRPRRRDVFWDITAKE